MEKLSISSEDLNKLGQSFASAGQWHGEFIDENMRGLGRRIAYLMQRQIERHRYTGALSDSVRSQYDSGARRLEIGPTAKRGRYDAGLLLQRGTRPIARLPFAPIAAWAEHRGLPAGPVWWKIKTKGVDAHPFLEETLERGDTQTALKNTAKRIGVQFVTRALQVLPLSGGGSVSFQSGQSVFS